MPESDHLEEVVPTYSIALRIQPTTTEFAYVSVPVNNSIMIEQPDGTGRIDPSKMVEQAILIAESTDLTWEIEDRVLKPHPLQGPPPWIADEK